MPCGTDAHSQTHQVRSPVRTLTSFPNHALADFADRKPLTICLNPNPNPNRHGPSYERGAQVYVCSEVGVRVRVRVRRGVRIRVGVGVRVRGARGV